MERIDNLSKYKNIKCTHIFQNKTYYFDSILEKNHGVELFKQLKDGKISDLVLQKEFQLLEPFTVNTNSTKNKRSRQRAITYVADFSYIRDGKKIVADSKGFCTAIYSLKKKLFLSQLKEHRVDEFQEVFKAETITYKKLHSQRTTRDH